MTTIEACKSVLADLEKASGADRDLEIRIATTIDGWVLEKRGKDKKTWLYKDSDRFGYERKDPSGYGYGIYPRLTNSIDATIALVERVLPGWQYGVENRRDANGGATAWCAPNEDCGRVRGKSPPLALLTALFRAKIAQMEKADG